MDKKLIIGSKAELKINLAMKALGTLEVSWFGKIKETSKGDFILTDVYFPPQENSAGFVTTKDDEFPKWFFESFVKKDIQNQIRLHGHTHPYFAAQPSGTDIEQFNKLVNEVDNYMIQLIMNNRNEQFCEIWYKDGTTKPLKVIFDYSERINKVLEKVCHRKIMTPKKYKSIKPPYPKGLDLPEESEDEYYERMAYQYFKDEEKYQQGSLFPIKGEDNGVK